MPDFRAADGTRLHYEDEGSGTPILALAGLSRNSTDFDYVAPYLSELRLIRMDYRGRGKSAWAAPDTYSIPQEGQDALALLDHLQLDQVAILGTSRGGLIAMGLAVAAKDRLTGICFNDIGPVIERAGLESIAAYLGQKPDARTKADAIAMRPTLLPGFTDVPESRWAEEVDKHYVETEEGLDINYDPKLRDNNTPDLSVPIPDLWPLFDQTEGLPLALIRGANSNLLSAETAAEMQRRRPDMIYEEVPGRGHVPFLDEPEALSALNSWLELLP